MRHRQQPNLIGIFLLFVVSLSISMLRTLALTNERNSQFLSSASKPILIPKVIEQVYSQLKISDKLFVDILAFLSYDTLPRHRYRRHGEASRH